jgi:hypothetical protein
LQLRTQHSKYQQTNQNMIKQVKLLLLPLLLVTAALPTQAQVIDSFHVNRSTNPHELFVRLQFPDSSYYVERTFDRVALIYPPVNITTFFYRSCQFTKASPIRDTTIYIYSPEPYGIRLYLAADSNTVTPGCTISPQIQAVDSAVYDSQHTGIGGAATRDKGLRIFPNPASDVVHIESSSPCEVLITDGLGRLQLRQKLKTGKTTIDMHAFAPGLYYIQCYANGRLWQSLCFSKRP